MVIRKDYGKYIDKYLDETEVNQYLIGKRKNGQLIRFIPMGFDIETYTYYEKDPEGKVIDHRTNMYIWQWQFGPYTFIGRTWREFMELIEEIECKVCSKNRKCICFICNMSFEFAFIGKELLAYGHEVTVFARKKRHPMKIEVDSKIIFLDTVLLTGFSLDTMAKNYCQTRKMVGDIDYTVARNSMTPLTDKELQYCINDVIILGEYARYYEEHYLKEKFLPMTSTMIAGRVVNKKVSELKAKPFYMMKKCYPKSLNQYLYIMNFYTGAYTHGMLCNLFRKLPKDLHWDVNSEYPWAFFQYYPVTKFRLLKNMDMLDHHLKHSCCLLEARFYDFETTTGVTILSENKIVDCVGCVFDNGRLYKGREFKAYITEVDLQTLALHSKWKKIEFVNVLVADRGFLPDYFLYAVCDLFSKKDKLKGVEGMEQEYMQSKKDLNGQYGRLCMKLHVGTEIRFDIEGWHICEKDIDFPSIWKSKNTLPQWAIYVTSHSRNLILSQVKRVIDFGGNFSYYYSDTDSIFCEDMEGMREVFIQRNKEIAAANEKWIERLKLKEKYPGVNFSKLGQFTEEEGSIAFKSLGSKRYLEEFADGRIAATVAGLPKGTFEGYCRENSLDPFDTFTDNFFMDDVNAHKLTAYYEDTEKEYSWDVVDKDGRVQKYTCHSYVSLIPTTFTMSVSDKLKMIYNISPWEREDLNIDEMCDSMEE